MIQASVYIICKNEEQHIKRALESVKDFAEIILVDSGSTDETLNIAQHYTSKIYHQDWLGFSAQKEYAKNLCTSEWILNLDADEELSPILKEELICTIEKNNVDGLDIKISGHYLGHFNHPWSKFNRRIRFFRKTKGHYEPKMIHESIQVQGLVKKAKGFIFDYGSNTIHTQVHKLNDYSTLGAKEKFEKKNKPSCIKLFLIFPSIFLKNFIIKRSFLNGSRGFISCMNSAFYAFTKEAKLYELWYTRHKNAHETDH
ncbi:MAG: hypothetical protein KU29_10785 [Sulfurovum sp. FS06-10]|nr:MAG: hypothetical protein KU29_10785 [Sulfurovum sp. FS06-10]